nr:immunoglobulin heavy chain junction region [Macaca mulatta]MOV49024.1 immunoglobulin heavy chain junction region [Macaca mulatta]MOV49073.1 immunoglobulin heavy chain junction region [Macaca mulatta]MOV49177.1 immunoglobulin heavy chain junction region [Macaca mulatta]MOV49223.1 immunoglobulin heavy chain junction region [Macaca mulatta]
CARLYSGYPDRFYGLDSW